MPECHAWSNAFSASTDQDAVIFFSLKFRWQSSESRSSWSVVIRCLRNPLCVFAYRLFLSIYFDNLAAMILSKSLDMQLMRDIGRKLFILELSFFGFAIMIVFASFHGVGKWPILIDALYSLMILL